MAEKMNKKHRYSVAQRTVIGLLTVALTLMLALGLYVFSLWLTDYMEAARLEKEYRNNISYASQGAGIGRDQTQELIRKGLENTEPKDDDSPPIVGVDQQYIEVWGQLLPVINASTEINSTCALLIERDSGQVLFSRNPDRSTYPASLAKIMTAVLGIELGPEDLSETVTITATMLEGLLEANASVVGFLEGEEVRYIDLLNGLLLPSGADAANAIAFRCAGSNEAFVELMNQKTKDLGMYSTNFTNVHGLHDVKMRTTASDIAKLFDYALGLEPFKDIIGKSFHTTAATNKHPDGVTFYSTLNTILEEKELNNGAVIKGGKTGTTTPAGQCLASYCVYEDREFILVSLGAFGYASGEYRNAADAATLYNLLKLN